MLFQKWPWILIPFICAPAFLFPSLTRFFWWGRAGGGHFGRNPAYQQEWIHSQEWLAGQTKRRWGQEREELLGSLWCHSLLLSYCLWSEALGCQATKLGQQVKLVCAGQGMNSSFVNRGDQKWKPCNRYDAKMVSMDLRLSVLHLDFQIFLGTVEVFQSYCAFC